MPMRLTLPSADLAILDQHQALLAQLALILEINADTVAIKRIPYLLSQVDLQQLAETVVNSLEKHGNDRAAMITTLSELIPLSPLTSQEQARQIIDALQHAPETMARWQQKLDPATLTGLFSN